MKPIRVVRVINWRGTDERVEVNAGSSDFKTLMGLDPNKHLPAEGVALQTVQAANGAYRMFCRPAAEPKFRDPSRYPFNGTRRVKSSKHRVFVVCDCGKDVPAGRLHQHICR